MVILPLPPQERVRRDFLTSEYERGGVPVFEVSYRQWKKKFYHLTNEDYAKADDFMGVYHNDPPTQRRHDLPDRFILINSSMNNSWRLAVFYHEIGHHSCVKMKCACARHGFVFKKTELHAELSAIYLATQRKLKLMTLNCMVEAIRDLEHPKLVRIGNATRMMKHSVFLDAKMLSGDLLDNWFKKNPDLKKRYDFAMADDSVRTCLWKPSRFLQHYASAV